MANILMEEVSQPAKKGFLVSDRPARLFERRVTLGAVRELTRAWAVGRVPPKTALDTELLDLPEDLRWRGRVEAVIFASSEVVSREGPGPSRQARLRSRPTDLRHSVGIVRGRLPIRLPARAGSLGISRALCPTRGLSRHRAFP